MSTLKLNEGAAGHSISVSLASCTADLSVAGGRRDKLAISWSTDDCAISKISRAMRLDCQPSNRSSKANRMEEMLLWCSRCGSRAFHQQRPQTRAHRFDSSSSGAVGPRSALDFDSGALSLLLTPEMVRPRLRSCLIC